MPMKKEKNNEHNYDRRRNTNILQRLGLRSPGTSHSIFRCHACVSRVDEPRHKKETQRGVRFQSLGQRILLKSLFIWTTTTNSILNRRTWQWLIYFQIQIWGRVGEFLCDLRGAVVLLSLWKTLTSGRLCKRSSRRSNRGFTRKTKKGGDHA